MSMMELNTPITLKFPPSSSQKKTPKLLALCDGNVTFLLYLCSMYVCTALQYEKMKNRQFQTPAPIHSELFGSVENLRKHLWMPT